MCSWDGCGVFARLGGLEGLGVGVLRIRRLHRRRLGFAGWVGLVGWVWLARALSVQAEQLLQGQADLLGGGGRVGRAVGEEGEDIGRVVLGAGVVGLGAVRADFPAQGQGGAEGGGLGVVVEGFEGEAVAIGEVEFGD